MEHKKNGLTYCVISKNSIFLGNIVDDVRQGHGYLSYPDGYSYTGEWKDNKRHGYGKYVWPTGDWTIGYWKNDFRNG